MCTSPITIHRRFKDGSFKEYLVPCGKCAECRKAYQSEFSLKVFLAAKSARSLHFYTFTYSDKHLPLAISEPTLSGNVIVGFARGVSSVSPVVESVSFKDYCRPYADSCGVNICPTLFREDIKNLFKRFRQSLSRKGEKLNFSYACFGEYGESRHRPHFHVLVCGLDEAHARMLADEWTFGYKCLKSIPRYNADGSDAFALTSKYVSKYVCKRSALPWFVQEGFALSPRCQSSRAFGRLSAKELERLRPFYLAEDCVHLDPILRYKEIIKRKKSISINNSIYKLPRYAHDYFYKKKYSGPVRWPALVFFRSLRAGKARAIKGNRFYKLLDLRRLPEKFRFDSRPSGVCLPVPLYRRALAFERELHNSRFTEQLRKGVETGFFASRRDASNWLSHYDHLEAFERETAQEKRYFESLRLVKDGQ